MLNLLGELYKHTYLRLFSSHLVLMAIGVIMSFLAVFFILPRFFKKLPKDRGKQITIDGSASEGKPTGAGLVIATILLPILVLVVPIYYLADIPYKLLGVLGSMGLIMYFGYLDDASKKPWGPLKKGLLDLICCVAAASCICAGDDMTIWVPIWKKIFTISPCWYIPIATVVLWITVNSTNCSDGVDGLTGSLGIISLVSLAAILYLVFGYKPVAKYLLLPYYPDGARWAIFAITTAGAYAGYLWHNAFPSDVLMGDAGSRMLGLAIGVSGLATGNFLMLLAFAPIIFINGGTGMVKMGLFKIFRRLGFDIRPNNELSPDEAKEQLGIIKGFHKVRFPLHDHCRQNLGWSKTQVVIRFILIQCLLIPILFAILLKVR